MTGTRKPRFRFRLWLIQLDRRDRAAPLGSDWRHEWEAELQHREALALNGTGSTFATSIDLLWRSTSAFWDAIWLQTHRWEDAMIQALRFGLRMLLAGFPRAGRREVDPLEALRHE